MLTILSRNRFACFCIAAMVLLSFYSDLRKIVEGTAFEPSAEQVRAFVTAASGPASVTEQLPMSWTQVRSIQEFIHYRIERFGMIGDLGLLACAAIGLCLLGTIGIVYHRAGGMTPAIRHLSAAVIGTYWTALFIGLALTAAHQLNLFRLDADGVLGVKVSWSLESDLRTLFSEPWSTKGPLGLALLCALPLIRQLGKSIEEEESTV